jgi:hypothetical protein
LRRQGCNIWGRGQNIQGLLSFNHMKLSIKKYIDDTIRQRAKIGYDKSVKVWYGILDHRTGLILSQAGSRAAVKKELAETLEDFIILSLKEDKKDKYGEVKAYKIQGVYR